MKTVKFLPRCQKCDSTDVDLYRDSGWSSRGWPYDATLHCRTCGHRLYGQPAVDHTTRERSEYLAAETKRAHERMQETERQRKLEEERQRQEAEAERLRLEEERKVITFPTLPSACAWRECGQQRRVNSIYCSRNCSNKNARARHASRRQEAR